MLWSKCTCSGAKALPLEQKCTCSKAKVLSLEESTCTRAKTLVSFYDAPEQKEKKYLLQSKSTCPRGKVLALEEKHLLWRKSTFSRAKAFALKKRTCSRAKGNCSRALEQKHLLRIKGTYSGRKDLLQSKSTCSGRMDLLWKNGLALELNFMIGAPEQKFRNISKTCLDLQPQGCHRCGLESTPEPVSHMDA